MFANFGSFASESSAYVPGGKVVKCDIVSLILFHLLLIREESCCFITRETLMKYETIRLTSTTTGEPIIFFPEHKNNLRSNKNIKMEKHMELLKLSANEIKVLII